MVKKLPKGITPVSPRKKLYDDNPTGWLEKIFDFELSADFGTVEHGIRHETRWNIRKGDKGMGTGANAVCNACWRTYTDDYKGGEEEMSDTLFLSDYKICKRCRTSAQGKSGNMFWRGDGFALLNEAKRCVGCDKKLEFGTEPHSFSHPSSSRYCSIDCYMEGEGT